MLSTGTVSFSYIGGSGTETLYVEITVEGIPSTITVVYLQILGKSVPGAYSSVSLRDVHGTLQETVTHIEWSFCFKIVPRNV
jgi:hypothetical protein